MKTKLILSLMMTTSLLAACGNPDAGKKAKDDVKKTQDSLERTQQELDEMAENALYRKGGEPGKISLFGVMAKYEGLDHRLSVQIAAGKDSKGKAPAPLDFRKSDKFSLSSEAREMGVDDAAEKTYLNFGCHPQAGSPVDGMREVQIENATDAVQIAMVHTILICGEIPFKSMVNIFNADHVVFIDADSTFKGFSPANLAINTNRLTLMGQSSLKLKGTDSTGVLEGPSLQLVVSNKIEGDGHLRLISEGTDASE